MALNYDDDEPIVNVESLADSDSLTSGSTKIRILNKQEAPLEETKFKVLVELAGSDPSNDRPGVDIVTVLDVSGSMKGEKLDQVKMAMQFLIKKLSPVDRLSIVTFSSHSERLCALSRMTPTAQMEIENLVNGLAAFGGKNIADGLEMAVQVLNDRKLTSSRVPVIMLMSDGRPSHGAADPTEIHVGDVPVYTFGFGQDYDPMVLNAIASHSHGGTFSMVDVHDTFSSDLNIAFSQCLAGLLTIVVQDLELTITQEKSEIVKVSAGNYPISQDDEAGTMTISFGKLCSRETRKVMVDLILPAVNSAEGTDVLRVTYAYRTGEKLVEAPPIYVTVSRKGTPLGTETEMDEVIVEDKRLEITNMMHEARLIADTGELDDAKDKLTEAQKLLEDVYPEHSKSLVDMLKYETEHLFKLMESPDSYKNQGHAFALASETSHDRQRFAARGDSGKLRLFSTPSMDKYLVHALSFKEDPSKPLPTSDDDLEE